MRLIFFGSGAFGLPTLARLREAHEIGLIVTQPDRPAGRQRALTPTPVAEFAAAHALPVIKPENVNEPAVVAEIERAATVREREPRFSADASRSLTVAARSPYVVIAFGQKLGGDLLRDRFAINLHGSLLPKYRGAAPINWAMIHGEKETGVSVITVAERMDAGEIFAQAATAIHPLETAGELHDRLAALGPETMLDVLRRHERGSLIGQTQDERLATRAPKLAKADGTVSFDRPAMQVRQRVHGLTPWPSCTARLEGRPLKLCRVQEVGGTAQSGLAGTLLADFTISCATGTLRLLEVQPPGGRVMSFDAYRAGHPLRAGARCETMASDT